jgi:hypothetical protein
MRAPDHITAAFRPKAIAGYAHGVSTGTPLGRGDFTGGDKTAAHCLETLGFAVLNLSNPEWTRDEIILACPLPTSETARLVVGERTASLSFGRVEAGGIVYWQAICAICGTEDQGRGPGLNPAAASEAAAR